jgi:hypothetical protein
MDDQRPADDRLSDDVRRAFGAGYRDPEPSLADRALAGAFERFRPADRWRSGGPPEHWLAAVAAVVLAVGAVAALIGFSTAARLRHTPASQPASAAGQAAFVVSPAFGAPLRRVGWDGRTLGGFAVPRGTVPGTPGLAVAPDGSRAAAFQADGTTRVVDSAGAVLASLGPGEWPADRTRASWADDSRHWCSVQGAALTYAEAAPAGAPADRVSLPGPARRLLACSATAGRAVAEIDRPGARSSAAVVVTVDLRKRAVARTLDADAGFGYGDAVASADGALLAESDRERQVSAIWDPGTGALVDRPTGIVTALSGDGQVMAVVSGVGDGQQPAGRLVDRSTGRPVWSGRGALMNDVVFRPGGRDCVVASGSDLLLVRGDGSVAVLVHGAGPAEVPAVYA